MARYAVLAIVLLIGGCTDVVSLTPGCGNFVLEPAEREDCDRPDGLCTADCRIACDPSMPTPCSGADALDGICCPDGLSCGSDGACRKPSGTFETSGVTSPFEVFDFRVADLDGDYVDDLLGISTGAVIARYGSSSTPLATGEVRTAPFVTGAYAIGDYTGDARPDILIPSTGGMFAFETTTGIPEPIAFPREVSKTRLHWLLAANPAPAGGVIQLDLDLPGAAMLLSYDGQSAGRPCGLQFGPANVHGRTLRPILDNARIVTPLLISGSAGSAVCLAANAGASPAVAFAGSDFPSDGVVMFADLNPANVCPELLVPVDATFERMMVVPGAGTPGNCSADPALAARTTLSAGIPLASVMLATGSRAVVTSAGVVTVSFNISNRATGFAIETYATRPWRYAIAYDFNGDSREDFAALGYTDDVEVFLQEEPKALTPTQPEWRQIRVPTLGIVHTVAAGDYDGDGHGDIAFSTIDFSDLRTAAIQVSYGPTFGAPSTVTSAPEYYSLTSAALADPSLPPGVDQSDDLVLAHGGDTIPEAPSKLVNLYGSPNRLMTAPWAYEPSREGLSAVIGNYGPNGTPGAIIAVKDVPWADPQRVPFSVQIGRNADTFDVLDASDIKDALAAFDLTSGTYVSVPRPDGELLLGMRNRPPPTLGPASTCGTYYLSKNPIDLSLQTVACGTFFPATASEPEKASLLNVTYAQVVAGQGSPAASLLVISDVAKAGTERVVYLWTLSVVDGKPVVSSPIDLTGELEVVAPGAYCFDAASAELGVRTIDDAVYGLGRELVMACLTGDVFHLYARFVDATGASKFVDLVSAPGVFYANVDAGDVNGDGLDDLIYVSNFGSARVHLQCDHHTPCEGGK